MTRGDKVTTGGKMTTGGKLTISDLVMTYKLLSLRLATWRHEMGGQLCFANGVMTFQICLLSRELTKPADRPILHRPGIGYVSSKNRGIGRASCVEPIPARRRPEVSNVFDIAGRPTPTRRPAGTSSETLPQKRHLQQLKLA